MFAIFPGKPFMVTAIVQLSLVTLYGGCYWTKVPGKPFIEAAIEHFLSFFTEANVGQFFEVNLQFEKQLDNFP